MWKCGDKCWLRGTDSVKKGWRGRYKCQAIHLGKEPSSHHGEVNNNLLQKEEQNLVIFFLNLYICRNTLSFLWQSSRFEACEDGSIAS